MTLRLGLGVEQERVDKHLTGRFILHAFTPRGKARTLVLTRREATTLLANLAAAIDRDAKDYGRPSLKKS